MKKNLGDRPRPIVRTPEQQRKHRAEQAARAILAGNGAGSPRWHANWNRIERHLRDLPAKRYDFMGLEIPGGAITRCWPDPEPTVETAA